MQIKNNWNNSKPISIFPSTDPDYGHIVYLETGTGKTYIAIMLLKLIFANCGLEAELPELKGSFESTIEPNSDSFDNQCMQLNPLTDQQMRDKRKKRLDAVSELGQPVP
jgi:hypothetical protein